MQRQLKEIESALKGAFVVCRENKKSTIWHIRKKRHDTGKHRRTSYEKKQVIWLADRFCQCRDGGRDKHGTGAGCSS